MDNPVENDWVGLITTAVEYYLGYNVSHLSDWELLVKYAQLDYIRNKEAEANKVK